MEWKEINVYPIITSFQLLQEEGYCVDNVRREANLDKVETYDRKIKTKKK
jgi:hypothetical protein